MVSGLLLAVMPSSDRHLFMTELARIGSVTILLSSSVIPAFSGSSIAFQSIRSTRSCR